LTRLFWKRIVDKDPLAFILLSAFLLRLVILPLIYDDYNYWAFGVFTSFLVHGQNPYHIVSQDPTLLQINVWRYPPAYLLFTAPATLVKQLTGNSLVYLTLLKIPLAVADVVSTSYLFKIMAHFVPRSRALKFSAFFAFNPLGIFEANAGFNDPVAIAFTVVSLHYFIQYRYKEGPDEINLSKSALFLGLGIATKIYPLLLIPVLVKDVKGTGLRLYYSLLALLPGAAVSVPFLAWDARSYLDLLTVRNVGGQHPLFPGLGLGGVFAPIVLGVLGVLLMLTYVSRMSLIPKIVLVFLWVHLAVFSQSFNYMVWGIPFFTLFVAEYRRLRFLPISPILTWAIALIFQGSYNGVTGAAGIFYWTYHLFQLQIVPFHIYPELMTVLYLGLGLSEAVGAYYFLTVYIHSRRPRAPIMSSEPVDEGTDSFRRHWLRRRVLVVLFLCGMIAISWGFVAPRAAFLPHLYPVVEGNTFTFTDNFHTSLIDYQWVFTGNGSYTITPAQGILALVTSQNRTSGMYRGWSGLADGFHTSLSARSGFLFRFDSLPPDSTGMTLANMTDGLLLMRKLPTPSFLYLDQVNNDTIALTTADSNWHTFGAVYESGSRTITLDANRWVLLGGSFARIAFGDTVSRRGYGGSAQFSQVSVQINDFPAGYESLQASAVAVVLPWLLIALVIGPLNQFVANVPGGSGRVLTRILGKK